jgi:hypothetical protein
MRAKVVVRKRPLGQGVREDRPADWQRTARHDDARHPDFPASEPGRVQRHHHGLMRCHEREGEADQGWTDRRLIECRSAPPAPHPS